jgi:Origin recognition complex (ORC) subunit 3 N-terminus
LGTFHERITGEVSEFVRSARLEDEVDTIPSAVIQTGILFLSLNLTVGNNIAGHARLFTQVKEQLKNVVEGPVVILSAAEVSNLQTLLRKIVAGCLEIDISDDDDEPEISKVCSPGI